VFTQRSRYLLDTCVADDDVMGIHKTVRPANRRTRASLPATFTLDHDETTGHRLRKLALDPRVDELLLDGRAVREVSPRGLGLLVAIHRLTDARGATMTLMDPSPELAGSIDRRGLTSTLLPTDPIADVTVMWPTPPSSGTRAQDAATSIR
jgi:anti-anti-sigma regulatory factor